MARIAGINILNPQAAEIGLTSIYGIGPARRRRSAPTPATNRWKHQDQDLTDADLSA